VLPNPVLYPMPPSLFIALVFAAASIIVLRLCIFCLCLGLDSNKTRRSVVQRVHGTSCRVVKKTRTYIFPPNLWNKLECSIRDLGQTGIPVEQRRVRRFANGARSDTLKQSHKIHHFRCIHKGTFGPKQTRLLETLVFVCACWMHRENRFTLVHKNQQVSRLCDAEWDHPGWHCTTGRPFSCC
jgi:hypothetical protein